MDLTMNDAAVGRGAGWAVRFAGAGALVLFLCWEHVQATRLGYRVEEARRRASEISGRVTSLRVELEQRLSPAQVATRAARLGMVPAAPDTLRRLSGGATASGLTAPLRGLWSLLPVPAAHARG